MTRIDPELPAHTLLLLVALRNVHRAAKIPVLAYPLRRLSMARSSTSRW
jgi:hypothetical protein